ncbi:hypothetical protein KSB_35530 [Ktedonobacter robiniae]|uniref:Uncharacterized protein n=1 Tax=Ktedonobacter robiniae TaxID=2778365 RepID=A0ABQ3UQL4_9CHLR|nr:hypothetical protein KSB_35530 [Ktedonobacter robiniae]
MSRENKGERAGPEVAHYLLGLFGDIAHEVLYIGLRGNMYNQGIAIGALFGREYLLNSGWLQSRGPRPYTVSVGNTTSSPARSRVAACARIGSSGCLELIGSISVCIVGMAIKLSLDIGFYRYCERL